MYNDESEIRDLLREALPPLGANEPGRDLWPEMLRRIGSETARRPSMRLAWWEWALVGLIPLWLAVFPHAILALLIQL